MWSSVFGIIKNRSRQQRSHRSDEAKRNYKKDRKKYKSQILKIILISLSLLFKGYILFCDTMLCIIFPLFSIL